MGMRKLSQMVGRRSDGMVERRRTLRLAVRTAGTVAVVRIDVGESECETVFVWFALELNLK